jgi:hypothetical protein
MTRGRSGLRLGMSNELDVVGITRLRDRNGRR